MTSHSTGRVAMAPVVTRCLIAIVGFLCALGSPATRAEGWTSVSVGFIHPNLSSGGNLADLTIDREGRPWVCWPGEDGVSIKLAHLDGATWVTETVRTSAPISGWIFTVLAFDSLNRPCIAYTTQSSVRFVTRSATGWSDALVGSKDRSGAVYQQPISMQIGPDDQPHVAFQNSQLRLSYATRMNGLWRIEVVDPRANFSEGSHNSIDLDASGNPHVAYLNGYQELKLASRLDGGWNVERTPYGSTGRPSLQMQGSAPLLAFGNSRAWFAQRGTEGWTAEVVDEFAGDPFANVSLALNPTGAVALAYQGKQNQIMYANMGNQTWNLVPTGAYGTSPSLDVTTSGTPYIAYMSGAELRVATIPEPAVGVLLLYALSYSGSRRRNVGLQHPRGHRA